MIIGRGNEADCVISGKDRDTVSRLHASLCQVRGKDVFLLEDMQSFNGTFVYDTNRRAWARIRKAEVTLHTQVRLGMHVATVEDLLRMRRNAPAPPPVESRGEPYRNEWGEIIH